MARRGRGLAAADFSSSGERLRSCDGASDSTASHDTRTRESGSRLSGRTPVGEDREERLAHDAASYFRKEQSCSRPHSRVRASCPAGTRRPAHEQTRYDLPVEAADRLAIRELVEAYAHCADRRDAKGQMFLFTEDTHFVVYLIAKVPTTSQELHW